jgi:hypothetical protein
VLSSFVGPRALEELHRAQLLGSSVDQRGLGASRAYCRVLNSGDTRTRLGRESHQTQDHLIQSAKAVRVGSVISNCAGLEVFCCTTIARAGVVRRNAFVALGLLRGRRAELF